MSTTIDPSPDNDDAWQQVAEKADLLRDLAADPEEPFSERAQRLLDAAEERGYL